MRKRKANTTRPMRTAKSEFETLLVAGEVDFEFGAEDGTEEGGKNEALGGIEVAVSNVGTPGTSAGNAKPSL